MDPSRYVVRRANVDDLGGLKLLWERSGLQVLELERHLTEFQLISSLEGDLIGAVGLRIEGKQGWLHSEAFTCPEEEEEFRPMLWDRLRTLCRNYGLQRLWTREEAPFYHQSGFVEADREQLLKLPSPFGDPHHRWWVLMLREEGAEQVSLEKEFELFQQSSRAHMEEVIGQAQKLRTFAYVVGGMLSAAAMGVGGYVLMRWLRESGRGSRRPPPPPRDE